MGVEVVRSESEESSRPLKALGVALAVDLVLMPLIFVLPLVGSIVVLAIVPYAGGRLGGRYTDIRTAARVGMLAAFVMVTVMATVFLSILASLVPQSFELLEPIGLSFLTVGYLVSIIFGALGGRHGAVAAEEG